MMARRYPLLLLLPATANLGPVDCALVGRALLNAPGFNKGSAFTGAEREAFGLQGMLPAAEHTLEQQVRRAYGQYSSRGGGSKGRGGGGDGDGDGDDYGAMAKNSFLTSVKYQNEVLYYALIARHLPEMYSVIYTPTEGDAIANYSRLFRRPDGCFLDVERGAAAGDREYVEGVLREWGGPDEIDYVVVTDAEEILGIGDQGVGGVGISTAKLVLMTVCAGLHPNRAIPVILDCGTDNERLLNDDLYLGLRQRRVRGERYHRFVDTFVQSVRKLFPKAMLHFEDFGLDNARMLLDKYRPQLPCFNDDIQGTGVVTLAAIYAGAWCAGVELHNLRMLVFGAGSAGTGIADQFKDAVVKDGGKSEEEARSQVWLVDKPGVLLRSMEGEGRLTPSQKPYARDDSCWEGVDAKSLLEAVKHVKPHVLVGCSTKPGSFTEEVVREMSRHVERPMIFPLSNPTRLHEARPADITAWSDGKALISTGSPFPPVRHNGEAFEISECNNATAFPGIGLGAVLCRAKTVSDKMLVAATKALAEASPALKTGDAKRGLLPGIVDVRDVSKKIAAAVITTAAEEGFATAEGIPTDRGEVEEWVGMQMWEPVYRELRKVKPEDATRAAKGELGVGRR